MFFCIPMARSAPWPETIQPKAATMDRFCLFALKNQVLRDRKLWLIICWSAQKCDTLGTPSSQFRFLTKRSASLSVSLIHLDVSGEIK